MGVPVLVIVRLGVLEGVLDFVGVPVLVRVRLGVLEGVLDFVGVPVLVIVRLAVRVRVGVDVIVTASWRAPATLISW